MELVEKVYEVEKRTDLPINTVITLKEITDLLSVRHDKAMKKIVELSKEPSFGSMSKMDSQYLTGKNTFMTIKTYALTKKQAIGVGARLNNTLLMKLIDRLEELESNKKPLTPLEIAKENVRLYELLEKTEEQKRLAIETKAEIGNRREASAMNTASQAVKKVNKLEIELDKSKEYCTIKRMQILFHGQNFNWRLLKSTGSEMGIETINVFDQNYGTVKAYHKDVWLEAYGLEF